MNESSKSSANADIATSEIQDGEAPMHETDDRPADSREKTPKPPRSRIEQSIVWGTICVLLVVVAIEGAAQFRFQRAFDSLSKKLDVAEETQSEELVVTQADVEHAVAGRSPETSKQLPRVRGHGDRVDGYRWKGVLKDRLMYVYYGVGDEQPVVSVTTELREPLRIQGERVLGSEDAEL